MTFLLDDMTFHSFFVYFQTGLTAARSHSESAFAGKLALLLLLSLTGSKGGRKGNIAAFLATELFVHVVVDIVSGLIDHRVWASASVFYAGAAFQSRR